MSNTPSMPSNAMATVASSLGWPSNSPCTWRAKSAAWAGIGCGGIRLESESSWGIESTPLGAKRRSPHYLSSIFPPGRVNVDSRMGPAGLPVDCQFTSGARALSSSQGNAVDCQHDAVDEFDGQNDKETKTLQRAGPILDAVQSARPGRSRGPD